MLRSPILIRPILIRHLGLATVFGCAVVSAACGQKGPLYRPDEKAQQVEPAAGESAAGKKKSVPIFPAPQSQKKDRTTETPPATDTAVTPPQVDPDRPATVPPDQSAVEK